MPRARYRGGNYRRRSAGSQVILYVTVTAVALWLLAPFAWLFVTSISYQKNLLARPFSPVPPEITFDNYRMVLGLVRFHAEGQASKILTSMWNSLVVAVIVTAVNIVVGTTAGYAYARFRFPLKTLSLWRAASFARLSVYRQPTENHRRRTPKMTWRTRAVGRRGGR